MTSKHLTTAELQKGLAYIRESPKPSGPLIMMVRRPEAGERELLKQGELAVTDGLVGDNWLTRGALRDPPQEANPDAQITLMNARAANLITGSKERWPLAGDQLYVDMDLGLDNLPAGTRLAISDAVVEVTAVPHTGCKKFVERFGIDAMEFVNSDTGRKHCLRGINTRIVGQGTIRVGDLVVKQ